VHLPTIFSEHFFSRRASTFVSTEASVAIREQRAGGQQWDRRERRRWPRQTLNRAVAVRGTSTSAEPFNDIALLLNLSRGGALLAISRPLVHASRIALHPSERQMNAADVRTWHMVRLRFREPLSKKQLQLLVGLDETEPVRGFRALLSHALAFIPRPA
jgi:hypothetical protein